MSKEELRKELREKFDPTIARLNEVLNGTGVAELEPVLKRIGRGGKVPHWFEQLRDEHTLPNLDGKTIGSVIEMLLLGVLETQTFASKKLNLHVNPARGTDIPDLDLSVKSPSTNYCTSEPFFSAYERLIGSGHDAVILLTDYQEKKDNPPLKLQILKWKYLEKAEIADANLCKIALKNRTFLLNTNEIWARKVFRFLAFVNQSDWLAKQLLKLTDALMSPETFQKLVEASALDFAKKNKQRKKKETVIPEADLEVLRQIIKVVPLHLGLIDALDSWVDANLQEAGRMPGTDEWRILKEGPLNGKIGMSFALQWRFNFQRVFNGKEEVVECPVEEFT